jgi:hypothetical protein
MADHVGIYEVSGALMQTPSSVAGTGELTSEQALLRSETAVASQYNSNENFVNSTTIDSVPQQTPENSIEVNQLNAFFSGTEPLEYQRIELASADVPSTVPSTWHLVSSGAFSATFDVEMAWKDLYYAKYPGIGTVNPGSNRLNYKIYKHVVGIADVLSNPPLTSPSASTLAAPTVPGNISLRLAPYKAKIGTVALVSTSGVLVSDWQTYVTGNDRVAFNPVGSYSTTGTFASAMAANLVYIGASTTASVTGVQIGAATSYDLSLNFAQVIGVPVSGDDVFLHSWVPLVSDVSGAYLNNTSYNPISIDVRVTDTGTIKNIKAWIEFIHDYRVSGSSEVTNEKRGLKNVQVALRSPNTSFKTSHPLWNGNQSLPLRTSATLTGVAQQFGNDYYATPSLLQNSYLLWDGHGVEDGLVDSLTTSDITNAYHEFDRDIDMRTIFWDGAPNKNPRDVSILLGNATDADPGIPTHPYSWLGTVDGGGYYKSPTWGIVRNISGGLGNYLVPGINPVADIPVSGAQVPWMLDYRLDLCGLQTGRASLATPLGTPPPGGWISGRGGLIPWTYSQKPGGGGTGPGFGGRVFLRPTTNVAYVLGGNVGPTPGTLGSGSWHAHYAANIDAQSFSIDPTLTINPTDVPKPVTGADTNPSPVIDTSVNYYQVSIGDGGMAGGNTERVLMVGGSSASLVTNAVYMGYWNTPGVEDITWTNTGVSVLPSGVTRHCSTVIDDRVYVAGGEKTAGVQFTGVFTGTIDQTSGKVTSWGEHLFPPAPLRNVTRMIQMGGQTTPFPSPSTSSDGGLTFVKTTAAVGKLVTGSAPNLTIRKVVGVRDHQYFAVAGFNNVWATTIDDGATWWTGSMTGTSQSAYTVCSASSGKVYTAGLAIMNAMPPTVFGQSINWTKNVDLVPRTTNTPTQTFTMGPGLVISFAEAQTLIYSNWYPITDRNSRFQTAPNISFFDPFSRTRVIDVVLQYRSNAGAWVDLQTTTVTLTGGSGGTNQTVSFDVELPDLPSIDVRIKANLNAIPSRSPSNVSQTTLQPPFGGTSKAFRPNATMYSIASGGLAGSGYLVAVGMSTSTVGSWVSDTSMTTWSHNRIGIDNDVFSSVAYGNGVWIAVGTGLYSAGAIIARSLDGSTWSRTLFSSDYTLQSVCYGNGVFVAVTNTRRILTSTDGITWAVVSSPMTDLTNFRDITWTGSKFVTLGYGLIPPVGGFGAYTSVGEVWYSSDGLSWTRGASNPDGSIYSTIASYIGTETPNLGDIKWSFFDVIPDQTGTLQKFGWTTFKDNTTGLLNTFRYALNPASSSWPLISDAGIVELSNNDASHYAPVVDDKHRVWVVDGSTSKYSQLSWDHDNERVIMSPVATANFGQTQGTLGTAVSMSIAFSSGVMVSLNNGTSSPEIAATAFVGPAPADDEFNTVGAQLGPAAIQPVYSMLNDVAAVKIVDRVDLAAATIDNSQYTLSSPRVQIIGSRPGLMGTESAGTWNFLFGTKANNFDPVTGYTARNESGIWIRQVRLELLTNLRMSTREQLTSKNRRFSKSGYVPTKDGTRRVAIQSGSAAWDTGINYIYVTQVPEYGRAIGITTDVNTPPDYAVLTFVTGNLYDQLVAEGVADPSHPTWYLSYPGSDVSRPSGIPYIPDSYMIAGTGTAEQVDLSASTDLFNNTVGIKTTVSNANAMADLLNRQGYTKTMIKRWEETIAAQASGSSSYYFPGLP